MSLAYSSASACDSDNAFSLEVKIHVFCTSKIAIELFIAILISTLWRFYRAIFFLLLTEVKTNRFIIIIISRA